VLMSSQASSSALLFEEKCHFSWYVATLALMLNYHFKPFTIFDLSVKMHPNVLGACESFSASASGIVKCSKKPSSFTDNQNRCQD
jgi:hypothetical protein